MRPSRPSFLRRSLAWDSAFFDSADPDELSFINKGFRKAEAHLLPSTQHVRNRRSESGSMPNGNDYPVDWLEMEPSIHEAKSCKLMNEANRSRESGLKQEGMQNVRAFKKVDKSCGNKMKSNQTPSRININVQGEGKTNKESTARRRKGTISSPKPPKAIGSSTSLPTRSNNKDLSGKSNLEIGNKSATTGSEQGLAMEKKSTSLGSPSLNSVSQSSPKFSFIVSPTSSLLKRKTELRKSQHSASLPTSKTWRPAERKKGMGNISALKHSLSLLSRSSTSHRSSGSLSSSVGKKERSVKSNDAKEASDLQSNLQNPLSSTKQIGSTAPPRTRCAGSLSAKSIRQSGLRPPSPHLRFFDENTPPRYHGSTRNRKMTQKVLSEGTEIGAITQFDHLISELLPDSSVSTRYASSCKKFKNATSEAAKNIKRPKTANTPLVPDKEDSPGIHAEATDQQNGKKNLSFPVDQLDSLSRHLEAIDLNQEKVTVPQKKQMDWHSKCDKISVENHGVPAFSVLEQENQLLNSPVDSSKPNRLSRTSVTSAASILTTRSPLAERTSTCNSPGIFGSRMKPRKEKLVKKASSVYSSTRVSGKENS